MALSIDHLASSHSFLARTTAHPFSTHLYTQQLLAYTPPMPKNTPPKKTTPLPTKVAPTQAHDPVFMAEIDAAMQQEKLRTFWLTYRLYLLAGAAAIVAGIIGWQGFAAYTRHQSASQAEALYQASKDADPAKLIALLPQTTGGNKALIAFTQARAAATPLDADRAYAVVYTDRAQPDWLRSLARLQAAMALMGRDNTLAQEHLTQLVQEQSHPAILPAALELLAIMAQNQGDVATARGYTQRLLATPQLTPDLRQRAQRRLAALAN